jgi:hypothetical protein
LDLRAAQLERVSAQLDSTKRSFDAANEENGWMKMEELGLGRF